MNRLNIGVCTLLLSVSAALGQAPATPPAASQTPAPSAEKPVPGTKVALFDMRRAITESEPGKLASAEYTKAMGPETAALEKLSKEAAEISEKLKNAKTDAEKGDLTRQLDAKTRDGQRAQEDAQKKSDELQDQLLPPIADLVRNALDAYATENGLAVVFDRTMEPSNIVHANMATDITNEVIRRVDAEYAKKPKPAAAPAPATTKP